MDISAILEAGLQVNAVATQALDVVGSTLDNMPMALESDCCTSNNYDEPPGGPR